MMMLSIHIYSDNNGSPACGTRNVDRVTGNSNDDFCIGDEFVSFRTYGKPRAKRSEEDKKESLSDDEIRREEITQTMKDCEVWDKKYPIGTGVWFQGDGKDFPILTKTRSKAQNYGTYMTIFLEGVSGCYKLDSRWVVEVLVIRKRWFKCTTS